MKKKALDRGRNVSLEREGHIIMTLRVGKIDRVVPCRYSRAPWTRRVRAPRVLFSPRNAATELVESDEIDLRRGGLTVRPSGSPGGPYRKF